MIFLFCSVDGLMTDQRNLFGQKHIWTPFLAALKEGRAAHAYLIHGPSGSGAMEVVNSMAKAILCPEKVDGFCDSCLTCSRVEHGSFCDLHIIAPEGTKITLDQVRGVLDMAYQYPMESSYRVFVIDSPEKMNIETANMLLKILEEPPADTRFLLGSENHAGILPTIVSRCQEFRMRPSPEKDIQEKLEKDNGLDPEQALAIARLADGSLGRAKELASEDFVDKRDQALALLSGLMKEKDDLFCLESGMALGQEYSKDRQGLLVFIKICLGLIRDAAVTAAGGTPEVLIHGDLSDQIAALAKQRPQEKWPLYIDKTQDLVRKIDRNLNVDLVLNNYLLALTHE